MKKIQNPVENEKKEWQKQKKQQTRKTWLTIFSPVFLLLIWQILAQLNFIDARFFPPPTAIISTFQELLISGELVHHVSISLFRIFAGFFLGVLPGVFLGLCMGLYAPIRHFLSPIVMALMPIPTLALLPIILILFGIGEVSKIVTIAGSVFFPVVINTVAGVMSIDSTYLDVAKNYGASRKDFFFQVAFPGALPVMLEGIQMGQAIALLTIVAAEMMGARSGIGYLIWSSYSAFLLKEMFVGLILISFFGYIFSLMLKMLERKLLPWR